MSAAWLLQQAQETLELLEESGALAIRTNSDPTRLEARGSSRLGKELSHARGLGEQKKMRASRQALGQLHSARAPAVSRIASQECSAAELLELRDCYDRLPFFQLQHALTVSVVEAGVRARASTRLTKRPPC